MWSPHVLYHWVLGLLKFCTSRNLKVNFQYNQINGFKQFKNNIKSLYNLKGQTFNNKNVNYQVPKY